MGWIPLAVKYHVQLHTESRADIWKFSTDAIWVWVFFGAETVGCQGINKLEELTKIASTHTSLGRKLVL